MKKYRLIFVLALVLAAMMAVPVTATAADQITVSVNDQELVMDQPPILMYGRTLVPLRAIFEALGETVEWNNDTRTVTCDWGYDSLSLQIGSNYIKMGDGRNIKIDVPAQIVNGRTLVPVRAISEAMGAEVTWDQATKHVDVVRNWHTWYVTNVDEFLTAIGSDTKIQMAAGKYDLTEWIEAMYESGQWSKIADNFANIRVEACFDGEELQICDVNNLYIEPDVLGANVEIVVEPRYADVLPFVNCSNIHLSDLTLGHTPEQGSCEGDVISTDGCKNFYCTNLDIYGCGAYGLTAKDSSALIFTDSCIHDCSYGLMVLSKVNDLYFGNCKFKDTKEFTMLEVMDSNVSFANSSFTNLDGNFIYINGRSAKAYFTNCTFDDNTKLGLADAIATYGSNKIVVLAN